MPLPFLTCASDDWHSVASELAVQAMWLREVRTKTPLTIPLVVLEVALEPMPGAGSLIRALPG
ncbi:hypothetical protein ADJ70_11675 [Olsenella sp. oral taxon 807]|uniref:hypothetical protein n=1 Tax=Olsenella sp. oral taxon 807 TaxID=712411 RepID=UPI000679F5C5|nr:hypothetical protein [Olsenella sp. oral taxon 807]AKT49455.1 hypothetical protein ADJ70_11675 [Olsenella sp. oral taxon 807]